MTAYSWFQNVKPLWATLHSGFCLPEFTDKQVDPASDSVAIDSRLLRTLAGPSHLTS